MSMKRIQFLNGINNVTKKTSQYPAQLITSRRTLILIKFPQCCQPRKMFHTQHF